MSHIFDALQRAEAERSGVEQDDFTLATELLKIATAEAAAPQTAQAAAPEPTSDSDSEIPAIEAPPVLQTRVIVEHPQQSNVFEQFESLPVVLLPNSKLVSLTEKDSLAAEKFRFLGVRLRQLQQARNLKRVLITSTIPEEGKTTVSANLACTLARRRQQKTLLLEGDLRRPTLGKQFGLDRVPGLSEYLQGSIDITKVIYRLDALGLWILPAGRAPENPLELMQAGKLSPLMKQLSSWFDWIVIDSPPVLPLADTSVWVRVADGVLLVTRQGKTEKQHLKRGIEAIDRSKLLGALINSSANIAQSNYYYRYGPRTPATPPKAEEPAQSSESVSS
jgi:capsular exopolysaccharide synthesis family protein